MTKTLLDKYQVNSRYQRSARIDTDWKSNIVDGYILHETARNVIIRLCEQFIDSDKAQKSFTITGPYGSGKSSLALIISNLVSSDIHEQKKTLQLFRDDKDKKLIRNALNSSKKGWVIIRVVGSRANPVEAIFQATKEAVKHRWKNVPESLKLEDTASLKKLIAYFEKLNDELLKSDAAKAYRFKVLMMTHLAPYCDPFLLPDKVPCLPVRGHCSHHFPTEFAPHQSWR